MKVIHVWKPLQDKNTEVQNQELVEHVTNTEDDFKNPGTIITIIRKKVPYWNVRSEMLKPSETYQEWLTRTKEKISKGTYKEKGVEGVYFYDIQPIGGILGRPTDTVGMMVRYDYICKSNLTEQ